MNHVLLALLKHEIPLLYRFGWYRYWLGGEWLSLGMTTGKTHQIIYYRPTKFVIR